STFFIVPGGNTTFDDDWAGTVIRRLNGSATTTSKSPFLCRKRWFNPNSIKGCIETPTNEIFPADATSRSARRQMHWNRSNSCGLIECGNSPFLQKVPSSLIASHGNMIGGKSFTFVGSRAIDNLRARNAFSVEKSSS